MSISNNKDNNVSKTADEESDAASLFLQQSTQEAFRRVEYAMMINKHLDRLMWLSEEAFKTKTTSHSGTTLTLQKQDALYLLDLYQLPGAVPLSEVIISHVDK